MTTLRQDLAFGARLLARQPGFTLVAVLVLSLGIGATTAAFSIVNTLLLRPRVGHTTGELVGLYNRDTTRPDSYRAFSYAEYEDVAAAPDLFESLTGHSFGLTGWTENDNTRRVFTDIVTETYFETFGVSPLIGRAFTREEARPGADIPVAIISHANWLRQGQPDDILGREIELNGRMFTVVGVAPPGFGGTMVVATPEVWVPTGVYESVAFRTPARRHHPGRRGSSARGGDPSTGRERPGEPRLRSDGVVAVTAVGQHQPSGRRGPDGPDEHPGGPGIAGAVDRVVQPGEHALRARTGS
jgi:hypothetical protein